MMRNVCNLSGQLFVVSEKTLHFQGKNKDLDLLPQSVATQLEMDGFKVQSRETPIGTVIQAQKAGILRDIITADRAFTILISGTADDFTIRVGVGNFLQNLAVMAVEAILITTLFVAVDIPEMLWTIHVENEIIQKISKLVDE
jgi:hypothetical protein